MKTNNDIVNTLKQANRVAIFIHTNPDGDCLGAASALKQALVLLNKSVDIFSDSVVSENYNLSCSINNYFCLKIFLLL